MDSERWHKGLSLESFLDGMTTNQELTRDRLQRVELTPDDRAFFARFTAPLHALVITEDWCGDSVMNLPILARIVEAAPEMDLRIWVRAQSPELSEYYGARGIANIPIFTFLDANWSEIGTWMERPGPAHARIREWTAAHPEVAAILEAADLTLEEKRERLGQVTAGLLAEMEEWYANGLQRATVNEISALLLKA
jgi:Thioredoxin